MIIDEQAFWGTYGWGDREEGNLMTVACQFLIKSNFHQLTGYLQTHQLNFNSLFFFVCLFPSGARNM